MTDNTDLQETLNRIAADHADDELTVTLDTTSPSAYITEDRTIVVNPDGYDQNFEGLSDVKRRTLLYETVAHLAFLSTESPLNAKKRFVLACRDKYDYETVMTLTGDESDELPDGPDLDSIADTVFNAIEDAHVRYAMAYRYRDRRPSILWEITRWLSELPTIEEDNREAALLQGFVSLALTGSIPDEASLDTDTRKTLSKIHPLLKRSHKLDAEDRMTVAHTVMNIIVRSLNGDVPDETDTLPETTVGEWYDAPEPDGFVPSPLINS